MSKANDFTALEKPGFPHGRGQPVSSNIGQTKWNVVMCFQKLFLCGRSTCGDRHDSMLYLVIPYCMQSRRLKIKNLFRTRLDICFCFAIL
jgi:hypothetical protein